MYHMYKGKLLVLEREPMESDKYYMDRIDFVLKNLNNAQIDVLQEYSYIYINYKYKKCIYNDDTMVLLNKFIDNLVYY